MPNGIDLILADHETVNRLFAEFDAGGDGAVIGQVIDALKAHDAAEHAALYPMATMLLGDQALLARSEIAHSKVKKQIELIGSLEGAPLAAAFAELQTLVTEHVADEQSNLLPKFAEVATPQQIDELGARILQAKQRGG